MNILYDLELDIAEVISGDIIYGIIFNKSNYIEGRKINKKNIFRITYYVHQDFSFSYGISFKINKRISQKHKIHLINEAMYKYLI